MAKLQKAAAFFVVVLFLFLTSAAQNIIHSSAETVPESHFFKFSIGHVMVLFNKFYFPLPLFYL